MTIPRKVEREEYGGFVRRLGSLMDRDFPGVCFYLYGSYMEDRFVPGVSDIDGGFIVNSGPVIDKAELREMSKLLMRARGGVPIPLQFNLLDLATSIDGRFLSYDSSYTDWFKRGQVKVVSGPTEYISKLNGMKIKSGELNSASMNLRTMRNALLHADENSYKRTNSEGNLRKSLGNALDKLTALPKKLVVIDGQELRANKSDGPKMLVSLLGGFKSPQLEEAIRIRSSQEAYRDVVLSSRETDVRRYLEDVVTGYEEIVERFIEMYPKKD